MSKWLNNLSSALDDLDSALPSGAPPLSSDLLPPSPSTLTDVAALREELEGSDRRNAGE